MAERKDKWETTANRFVAYFDIMGFKDRVSRNAHKKIYKELKQLSHLRNSLLGVNNLKNTSGTIFGESQSYTFSDSIIIFSKGDSIEDARKIVLDSVLMLYTSIKMGIPIKGAASYGKITVDYDNLIYFGQPLIDAYLLHEELLLYTLVIDNSFEKRVKELNRGKEIKMFLVPYKVPMKSGKINHYIMRPQTGQIQEAIDDLDKLYHSVCGKPRQYIDNTMDFLKSLPPDNLQVQ